MSEPAALSAPPPEDPLAIVEQPLPVPERAAGLDLADAFSKLLFRCALLERKVEDGQRAGREAQRDLLLGMLEIHDALDALVARRPAAGAVPGAPARLPGGGAEGTLALLRQKLALADVKEIQLGGSAYLPGLVDVVESVPVAGVPEETIVEVVVPGFLWQGQPLRRAQVKVSRRPDDAEEADLAPGPAAPEAAEEPDGDGDAPAGAPPEADAATPRPRTQPKRKPPKRARTHSSGSRGRQPGR